MLKSQGYFLCKYVNQRFVFVVWNSCGTCNCTIVDFSFLWRQKTKLHCLIWCQTLKCTCVPFLFSIFIFFFFFEKHWKNFTNLFMLSFFVGVCKASQSSIFVHFCKYIFSLLFLWKINCCKTEPNNGFYTLCVLYFVFLSRR